MDFDERLMKELEAECAASVLPRDWVTPLALEHVAAAIRGLGDKIERSAHIIAQAISPRDLH